MDLILLCTEPIKIMIRIHFWPHIMILMSLMHKIIGPKGLDLDFAALFAYAFKGSWSCATLSMLRSLFLFSQVAFFRHFVASVTKVDYLTMRHGFINVCIIHKVSISLKKKKQQWNTHIFFFNICWGYNFVFLFLIFTLARESLYLFFW